jgi:hypothetical protein
VRFNGYTRAKRKKRSTAKTQRRRDTAVSLRLCAFAVNILFALRAKGVGMGTMPSRPLR